LSIKLRYTIHVYSLEDFVWSTWSSWSPCDCELWKIESTPQLLRYKNVFQSRKRSIIEDNLSSFGKGSCVQLGNREIRKCKNEGKANIFKSDENIAFFNK